MKTFFQIGAELTHISTIWSTLVTVKLDSKAQYLLETNHIDAKKKGIQESLKR